MKVDLKGLNLVPVDDEGCRQISTRAAKEGVLIKQPCFVCGDDRVEMHHPDYNNPFNVIFLCRKHHRSLHTITRDQVNMSPLAEVNRLKKERPMVTYRELASALKECPGNLRDMIKRGLPHYKVLGHYRFDMAEVDEWMERDKQIFG